MGNDIHRMQEVGHGLYARNAADLFPCLSDIFGILFLDGETCSERLLPSDMGTL